jgi:hypothetical protein
LTSSAGMTGPAPNGHAWTTAQTLAPGVRRASRDEAARRQSRV